MVLLGSAFGVVALVCFLAFPLLNSFPLNSLFSVTGAWFGSGVVGGALGWVASRAGLWGVPLTWVWVVGFSPQILEHPTSICDTGVNLQNILGVTKWHFKNKILIHLETGISIFELWI